MVTRFTNALVKSRPIRGLGGEQVSLIRFSLGGVEIDNRWGFQLLLDLQSFKASLLKIPGAGASAESTLVFLILLWRSDAHLEGLRIGMRGT